MAIFFISRHLGAISWIHQQSIDIDHFVKHLEIEKIHAGDTVIGTLPLQLAFAVQERGARYLHLTLNVPADWRGTELTVEQLQLCNAHLVEYQLNRVGES